MKNFIGSLSSALLLLALALPLQAQSSESQILNTITSQELMEDEVTQTAYSVNSEVFNSSTLKAGNALVLERGEGVSNEFLLIRKTEYRPGMISITAREKGNPDNLLIATYGDGRLNGVFHESNDSQVYLSYDPQKGQHFITNKKPANTQTLSCGIHENTSEFRAIPNSRLKATNTILKAKQNRGTSYTYSPAPAYVSTEDSLTIDLMLVHTDAAEIWASTSSYGDIDGVIAQAMNLSQAALDNSKTGIELRLVHVHKTTYDETTDGADSNTRLYRLTQNPDDPIFDDPNYDGHMEQVHTLRDQYGADIVSMLAKIDDTGGLGWRISATEGAPYFGFNLNRVQQVASDIYAYS